MESVTLNSKSVKAKYRATNDELLHDFSALLNSRLTRITQINPHQQSPPPKPTTHKRRKRLTPSIGARMEGVLGFASFLCEAEHDDEVFGHDLKDISCQLSASPQALLDTPSDLKAIPPSHRSASTKVRPIWLKESVMSLSTCKVSASSSQGRSKPRKMRLMSISHLNLEPSTSEPEAAKRRKVACSYEGVGTFG
jgi:hypothetical protein